jgi:hypothetical protein
LSLVGSDRGQPTISEPDQYFGRCMLDFLGLVQSIHLGCS